MIKNTANAILRNFSITTNNLWRLPKFSFATNPFDNPYGDKQNTIKNVQSQIKAGEVVSKNVGLNKFITRIYNTTGLSILGALSAGYLGMSIPLLMLNPLPTILLGGLLTIGSLAGVQMIKPTPINQKIFGVSGTILKTQNSISRIMLYSLGVFSLGISASPLFAIMQAINPSIIPTAIGITFGIFGGASAVAYTMPKDKMLGYGRVLMGSLLGLIGMQFVGLGSAYFMGPNTLSSLLFSLDTYGGILLFSGFIGYDTHVAIKQYENGNADHLGVSVQMLLNFWNILIRVMQILSRIKKN